ncbi:serine/threonine protein kinase [Candidatus Woesearchaeota archaeon]|nr:serine/threonine protein kinase [Candidatus Woesearchaeota archaeon]
MKQIERTLVGIPWDGKTIAVPVLVEREVQEEIEESKKITEGEVIRASGGKYKLEERLGDGGMGEVWKANVLFEGRPGPDDDVERPAAIKFIRDFEHDFLNKSLIKEAQILAEINHDNMVHFGGWAYSKPKERYLLIMEYIRGMDITGLIRNHNIGYSMMQNPKTQKNEIHLNQNARRIPDQIVEFILFQVANGLDYAHNLQIRGSRGVIHRDISPGNILIKADEGAVKISDFGIAVTTKDLDREGAGFFAGKLPYVAPEAIIPVLEDATKTAGNSGKDEAITVRGPPSEKRTRIDARSDLYSLGVVAYEMLTGLSPNKVFYTDPNEKMDMRLRRTLNRMLISPLIPPTEIVKGIDSGLSEIVCKMLSIDPEDRYQNAAELRQAVGNCMYKAAGMGIIKSDLRDYLALNVALGPDASPESAEFKGLTVPLPFELTTYATEALKRGENPARY